MSVSLFVPIAHHLRRFRRGAMVIAIGLGGVLLPTGCQREASPPPLRIGTNLWPGYGPLYLSFADPPDSYPDVRLIEYESSASAMSAFRNGLLEAVTITLNDAISLARDIPDLTIVSILNVSHGGDAIIGEPTLSGLADLKGARIGLEGTALASYMATRALEHAELQWEDVHFIFMSIEEQVRAFQEDRIDAVVTYDPTRRKLLNLGGQELFTSRDIPGEIIDVLVVRQSLLDERPEQIEAVLTGWLEGVRFLRQHPLQAHAQIAPILGLTPPEVAQIYEGILIFDQADCQEMKVGPNSELKQALTQTREVMIEHGFLKPSDRPEETIKIAAFRLNAR
jgi:NitT/TauT family transport system substrate-binding protein